MNHDATASVGSIAAEGASTVRAASESGAMQAMARAGLATRGLTYLIIALIAAQIPFGGSGESADQHGAIEDIASKPFGRILLIAMAIGFGAYALWRWTVALVGGHDAQGASRMKRLLKRTRCGGDGSRLCSALRHHRCCGGRGTNIIEHATAAERDCASACAPGGACVGDCHRRRRRDRGNRRALASSHHKV